MDYLPPFEEIKTLVTFSSVRGELTITASFDEFNELIRALLQGITVDEAWYLNQYPDVADAVRKGSITSARAHFLDNGYFEGRMPFLIKVDDEWYFAQNPGVAEYVAQGKLESAQQHFNNHGYREGRRPFPT